MAVAAALLINLVLLSILPVVNLGTISLPENNPALQPVSFVHLAPPKTIQTLRPDQPSEMVPRPDIPVPRTPEVIDLSPESLEQTLRPDLQPISLQADLPQLTDIPLASVDFNAIGMDGVFDADELDNPLLAVSRVPPFYPLQARRASVEGWVEITFQVNTRGRVDDVIIIDARPPGVFEKSVRQAVSGWRFQPGTVMGEPVKARVTTTIRFELEENQ